MRAGLALLMLCWLTEAGDKPQYPEGRSTQTYKGREFELLVPANIDVTKRYSLMFVVGGGTGAFARLDGFFVCASRSRAGAGWATSEAKELHGLLDHLVKALPVDSARLHAVGLDDWQGFFPHVAFRKKGHRFVSACFLNAVYRGGGLPADAKKKLGILILGDDDKFDESTMVERLRKKVRTAEWRPALGFGSEYFRYWLGVMEGRFEPGVDLSFKWHTDPVEAKGIMAKGKGGFLYFFDKKNVTKEAKRLQNEIFFDPAVRAAGEMLVATKLNRNEHKSLFTGHNLTKTPAVVVLTKDLTTVKTFEGRIKARALATALRRAAGSKPK